ncbi:MAG TPA: DUF2283 domain-containing protein [Dehalococcoidia bacterium]|jgi:uncharacterized protein YuzE|nr:DUF2283 domain-containing protein [Dehalococcoidia bacterium]
MAKEVLKEKIELDYDPEGDVLYISFGEPQAADDADISEDDIIVRTRAGKIVGLTILNARARLAEPA